MLHKENLSRQKEVNMQKGSYALRITQESVIIDSKKRGKISMTKVTILLTNMISRTSNWLEIRRLNLK